MVLCFAACCNHRTVKNDCSFFRFPKDRKLKALWTDMSRRADREPNGDSRLCSCHFKDGKKENNPTIFSYCEKKRFDFPSPEKKAKKTSFKRPVCSAHGCSNTSIKASCKEKRISFHRMPFDDKNRLKLWLVKMRRKHFHPTENTMICSEHFTDADFEYQPFTNRRGLKKTAVPTKFCFTATDLPKTSDESESSIVQHDMCETETSSKKECSTQTNDISTNHLLMEIERLKTENAELKTENAELKTENAELKTDVKTFSEYLIQLYETS